MSYQWIQSQESSLIYVGDPMCSWCYGIAPELTKLNQQFEELEFRTVVGGLRPDGTEKMSDLKAFLTHHWEDVNKRSGQPFDYAILDQPELVYNTEPACRAVVTMRHMASSAVEFEYFKAIQTAFYQHGRDVTDASVLAEIAGDFGQDQAAFLKMFNSEEMIEATDADFNLALEMGVRGFPSLVFKHNGQFYLLANGYQKSEAVAMSIQKIISTKAILAK